MQKMMFFISLISSIVICFSSNSMILMWMSMEINLFSMIPIISMNMKYFNEKSSMIYFLIQCISSSILLICISTNHFKSFTYSLMMLSMFMKLGMFPFHFWMLSVVEGMKWNIIFILMTIQKMIPLSVIMNFIQQKLIILMCLMNSLIGAINGISMFSTRKIMTFSSMNHLSIMILALILSKKLFKTYFLIYMIMTFYMTKMMKKMNMNFLFQMMTNMKSNKLNNLNLLVLFLSMAGIPPFLGFMPKMLTIIFLIKSNMYLTSIIILLLNTLSTFFYLRMSMNNFLLNMNQNKNKIKNKTTKFPLIMIMTPTFMLFMLWNFKLMFQSTPQTINFQN